MRKEKSIFRIARKDIQGVNIFVSNFRWINFRYRNKYKKSQK